MVKRNKDSGFTIVELLIVIVIIGILATIVIVSYNGITKKARESTLMSDLNNDARLLEMYKVENGDYPAQGSEGQVNNGHGLVGSNGNVLTYSVLAGKYCLEAKDSSGQYAYKVEQDKSGISEGACQVMPTGPVITNLYTVDPSFEAATSYLFSVNNGGSASASIETTGVVNGQEFRRLTFTGTGILNVRENNGSWGFTHVTPGQILNASVYVRSSVSGIGVSLGFFWRGPAGQPGGLSNETTEALSGSWQRMSVVTTVPAAMDSTQLSLRSTDNFTSGNTVDIDAIMITQGNTLYRYADGDSLGWSWSGTPYQSTSSGPSSLP